MKIYSISAVFLLQSAAVLGRLIFVGNGCGGDMCCGEDVCQQENAGCTYLPDFNPCAACRAPSSECNVVHHSKNKKSGHRDSKNYSTGSNECYSSYSTYTGSIDLTCTPADNGCGYGNGNGNGYGSGYGNGNGGGYGQDGCQQPAGTVCITAAIVMPSPCESQAPYRNNGQ
ncbi:hypothetical protein IW146_007262, partial [Coemansia sp. RSA 922]